MTKQNNVTLSLGDGGQATLNFIRDEILQRFGNPVLNELEDASWISLNGSNLIVTTDSFVVNPPIFAGGDIGRLAICGTINDLVASGACPKYLTFSLIVTVGFPLVKLRHILDSALKASEAAGVLIVAGDTKVIEAQRQFEICINTTGLGIPIRPGHMYSVSSACNGDKVIVTGSIGDHGLAILSQREGLGFEKIIQSDCSPLSGLLLPVLSRFDEIHSLRDPTRGGIVGVLNDIAESSNVDLIVNERSIPIHNEVKFGCEMLGLDALTLVNEGKMVVVVSSNQADEVIKALRDHPDGYESAIIGEVRPSTGDRGKVILNNGHDNKIARRQYGQSLPRLC